MSGVTEYFAKVVKEHDTTIPEKKVLLEISETLDRNMNVVANRFFSCLEASKEHEARVAFIKKADRLSGKFDPSKVIFKEVNPYEQMSTIKTWLHDTKITKSHTFFLSSLVDDYIPAGVKKIDGIDATTMHVVLGSTRGEKAAPKYEDWAIVDPLENQEAFMKPLTALEVVRQPNFSFATIVKDEAYRNEVIDNAWRYGSTYACVEDKGQSKNSQKKLRSAAFNLCSLINEKATHEDVFADDVIINNDIHFADFSLEKSKEALDVSVSIGELFKACNKAIIKKDEGDLQTCLENLFISNLGPVSTEMLKALIARILEKNNKEAL
jgi:hypothetical protein